MGRTVLKLKPFITESLLKGYINLKRVEGNCLEIYTPRYTKNLDPAYEELFKAYEECNNRKYKGYEAKDTLKSAIRRSKDYEVISHVGNRFLFQERTRSEIENLKKKKKKNETFDASPASSGYGSGESPLPVLSPIQYVPSPPSPFPNPRESRCHENLPGPMEQEIQSVDTLDVNMDEIRTLQFTDEEYMSVTKDIMSRKISLTEIEQYLDGDTMEATDHIEMSPKGPKVLGSVTVNEAEQHHNNINQSADYMGVIPEGSATGNEVDQYLTHALSMNDVEKSVMEEDRDQYDTDQPLQNIGARPQGSVDKVITYKVHQYPMPDGRILLLLVPE